jgi:hypothetical protein
VHDASSELTGGGRVRIPDPPPPWRFALVFVLLSAGCGPRRAEEAVMPPSRPLVEVLAAHTPEWMALPGVAGTAESQLAEGSPCILVIVVRLTPELRKRIPETVEGWPVRIEETGEIRAMPDSGR